MRILYCIGKRSAIVFLGLLFIQLASFGQSHTHSHARNEIGISPGVLYSPSHDSWGFGLHAHYFRTLGEHSRWAVGGGVEKAFLHGGHWTIGAGVRYQLFDRLSVAAMPGISFLDHDEHIDGKMDKLHETKFSIHFEVAYDLFEWKHFHLGPVADYSWSKEDSHFMVGIHCAYLF